MTEQAQDRLRTERLAQLGALLAGFAHEIRNPLSTIGLNLQLVKEDFAGLEGQRERRTFKRLSVVEQEVRRLQGILEQFLGYLRAPAPKLRPVDVNVLLQSVVDFNAPEMAGAGVALKFFPGPDVGTAELDPDLIRAALINLLRNARQACAEGGEVLVASRRRDSEVSLQITDTGAGMSTDVLARAFTPYFSTKPGGTGLGLASVRRTVEEHGGQLEVSSEPGKGTQFILRLPVAGRAAAAEGSG